MSAEPTPYDLAQIAAKLSLSLSPQEAVARAQELFSAADEALRADEIADEQLEEQFREEAARLAQVGLDLFDEKIGLSEAFQTAAEIAGQRRVQGYKTEKRFIAAMRKARLTVYTSITGKMIREWIKSDDPEMPITERLELTSVRAVEELFNQKAVERKKADRRRKAEGKSATPKPLSKENFRKSLAEISEQKPERKSQERNAIAQKRNRTGK